MNNKAQSHFRSRMIDYAKPMTIYRYIELPEYQMQPAVTRMLQEIPTGMEKNEEKELHLQQAIDRGGAIPVPEVEKVPYHLSPYVMPKHLIQTHTYPLDEEGPDYDADSDDENFLKQQSGINLHIDHFEKMIAAFENGSTRTALTIDEAKALFPADMVITITVYEYWLNKRLSSKCPLIPTVPTESRLAKNQAYVAFRKRIDKRVTRRNRRNDENSYYRMLRLKTDLEKVVQCLNLVKQRENAKRDRIKLDIDILAIRFGLNDGSDAVYRNVIKEELLNVQPTAASTSNNFQPKKKYLKQRKPKPVVERKQEEDESSVFAFRRKSGCHYLPPVNGSFTERREDNDNFIPGTIDGKTLILIRRRVGRGGRIILDRRIPPIDIHVDSSILSEIQSKAVGEFMDYWSINVENEVGNSFHCELHVPDVQRVEETEVVRPRGKKSFTDHLNEIRYRDASDDAV